MQLLKKRSSKVFREDQTNNIQYQTMPL